MLHTQQLEFTKRIVPLVAVLYFFSHTLVSSAQSKCSLNGEPVPCDEMPAVFEGIFIGVLGFVGLVLVGLFIGTIFWIYTIIDVLKNQKEDKAVWFIVIFFLFIFGSLLYFFIARSERKKRERALVRL